MIARLAWPCLGPTFLTILLWPTGVEQVRAQAPATINAKGYALMLADHCPAEIELLYRGLPVGPLPSRRVRGFAIVRPGDHGARARTKATQLVWQGKTFSPEGLATNRFFGLNGVPASVHGGVSWVDGGPTLVLDYARTSRIYRHYRDEIRQIALGLYLGIMHDRRDPSSGAVLYFVLEDLPG